MPAGQTEAFAVYRYHAVFTDSAEPMLAVEATHRDHAIAEQVIAELKNGALAHLPSRSFAINAAWLTVVMLAVDLLAWTQHLLLTGDTEDMSGLVKAEPKTLRYRLLHVAARLTRGGRRVWLRIQRSWPWARQLAAAFASLAALPVPG